MGFIQIEPDLQLCVTDLNPKGDKTVVFLHGWPFTRDIFEYQLNVLPRHGIRCVSIDLRGFGDSGKPWGGYSYNRMADDIHKVLNLMNLRNVTLFGCSMGGAVCVRYLTRHGYARVGRLVLCGAACPSFVERPGYPYGKTVAEVEAMIAACCHDRPKAIAEFGKTCFHSKVSEEFSCWASSLCHKSCCHSMSKSLECLRDEDFRDEVFGIHVPTAIFHGLHDKVCPFIFASLLHESIRGSSVVPFEHSGHALFFDEREKCNTALLDFLGVKGKA